jgi:hypothetical protein
MKPKRVVKQKVGPSALTGSTEAKCLAAVILEVLAGLRDAREGSRAMSVSINRYYQLETRALQGLITALEPRPKGRRWSAEEKLARMEREKRRLEQELGRMQALVRAAQRSMGIPAFPKRAKEGKLTGKDKARGARRRIRSVARGLKMVAALQESAKAAEKSAETTKPSAKASP